LGEELLVTTESYPEWIFVPVRKLRKRKKLKNDSSIVQGAC
jgi:hypothetical protein